MSSSSSLRIALVALALVVVWAIWVIWGVDNPKPMATSANADVALYSQLPSGFPGNLWMNGSPPQHADVTRASSTAITTVVYAATQTSLVSAISVVQQNLQHDGWAVGQNKVSANSGFIAATKDSESMVVTFVYVAGNVQATFQLTQ